MFLLTGSGISCSGDPTLTSPSGGGSTDPNSRPASAAMGRWTPDTRFDTCTKAFHDTYFVIGPDGKKYPTWHPPSAVDPANNRQCTFGHEHGRDPRASAMWIRIRDHFVFDLNGNGIIEAAERDASGLPFGYAAEQLIAFNATNGIANANRIQDHVGYKVAWENGIRRSRRLNTVVESLDLYCDALTMLHQDTHSVDAVASNLHELVFAIDCSLGADAALYGGTVIATTMATFGAPGGFVFAEPGGGFVPITFGIPQPTASPPGGIERGRVIPTIDNVIDAIYVPLGATSDFLRGLAETWSTIVTLRRADTTLLASFDPAFRLLSPSRYFDASRIDGIARSIDVCTSGLNAAGVLIDDPLRAGEIVRQARGPECQALAPNGPATPRSLRVAYDDPKSTFNGCRRQTELSATAVRNTGGATLWHTDPYGNGGRPGVFAGGVRQYVSSSNNGLAPALLEPTAFGNDIDACPAGNGIHAPN
ncbi:MAG: hypothetical protein ACREBN_03210 [Burkholderiaceae bacterium]